MKNFLCQDFLLESKTAVELYASIRELPIIDYHCHLDPAAIADNRRFGSITELWLGGDHYKWRLMRAHGVPESHITGDAPDAEKFAAWCDTLQVAIGSPLYHWSHMELKKYFGWEEPATAQNAAEIFVHCNTQIEREDFCVHELLKRSRVEWLATTDDPADSLEHHARIKAADAVGVPRVLPTFRPGLLLDPARRADKPNKFAAYIMKLSDAAQATAWGAKLPPITDWASLLVALENRLDHFAAHGCVISDHSLEPPVFTETATDQRAAEIFKQALNGEAISQHQADEYKTRLLSWLGAQYKQRGWVMQLHMGAMRANNSRMLKLVGADAGFDSMNDAPYAHALSRILDDMESRDALPRTILYGLNPIHDAMLAAMIGNFQGRGIRGRIQWGAPWWFNDSKAGMEAHLSTLGTLGMLAHFVGMLTDSRSFISYPRHDYFRRILANRLGAWAEAGEFPRDMELLTKIAGDIAYYNAKRYFS